MPSSPRKADRQKWRASIVSHLEDFPRQYAALEFAMGKFGDDFDVKSFKQAYDSRDDPESYNQAQALERSFGRVQNYIADLAEAGAKLAQLSIAPVSDDASKAQRAFEALRDAGAIKATLCRRLTRAQNARSRVEHSYAKVSAGDVHSAAELVHEAAAAFIGPYTDWIGEYLVE